MAFDPEEEFEIYVEDLDYLVLVEVHPSEDEEVALEPIDWCFVAILQILLVD